ncbi:hypothetical protein SDC9_204841 [bioreactor metagenome]|uniref:Uncharacterized protein n=1 Tax=bioreactor metagenome TaxID=1076179 RepID=A0A645J167_9ZZZZ
MLFIDHYHIVVTLVLGTSIIRSVYSSNEFRKNKKTPYKKYFIQTKFPFEFKRQSVLAN